MGAMPCIFELMETILKSAYLELWVFQTTSSFLKFDNSLDFLSKGKCNFKMPFVVDEFINIGVYRYYTD